MASQFQGFNIVLNLSESDLPESDINILNNLGGGNISSDLLTFYNNLRNFSQITVAAPDISGNLITKSDTQAVFTTGTKITVNDVVYYVKDSDGKTRFRLSTQPDLSTTVSNPPVGTYIRSDAVTLRNIANLAVTRPRTVEDLSSSRRYENLSSLTNEQLYKLNTSLIAMINSTGAVFFPTETSTYIEEIESAFALYEQISNRSIIRDQDFSASSFVEFRGAVKIVDTGNLNDNSLSANSNPGVFIVNPRTGEYVRAFSSDEDVWSENGANLVVDSTSLIIGDLSFTGPNGIDLLSKGSAVIVESVTPSANLTFTHYVDVTINGESYSLCLFT